MNYKTASKMYYLEKLDKIIIPKLELQSYFTYNYLGKFCIKWQIITIKEFYTVEWYTLYKTILELANELSKTILELANELSKTNI